MAEWLVERGVAETRALLVEDGTVLAAKLHWPGEALAGQRLSAKLTSKQAGSQRGTAVSQTGLEMLVDRLPRDAAEGQSLDLVISRAAVAERGRLKQAQARLVSERDSRRSKAQDTFSDGTIVRRFEPGLWEEVWEAAWSGEVAFAGGSLLFSVTPAMTVIDVDGDGSPRELALASVPAIAAVLRKFDCGGSIGIDFPTIADKAGRRSVDEALAEHLADFPHERTAMNGFGFVQLVARLEGPSLLHRMEYSRVGAAARMVLRRAEQLDGAGTTQLTVHPALTAKLKTEWLDELRRRTGRAATVLTDPGIALGAGHVQIVSDA